MWYTRLFKPIKKIGVEETVVTELIAVSLCDRMRALLNTVDVDKLVEDPVLRRFFLTVHWSNISFLFDAVLYRKRESPGLAAVNIYSYFKAAGTPASICLLRLCATIESTSNIPHTVTKDVEQLIEQLQEASRIGK